MPFSIKAKRHRVKFYWRNERRNMVAFSGTWRVCLLNWKKEEKEGMGQVQLLWVFWLTYHHNDTHRGRAVPWDPLSIRTLLVTSDRIPIPSSLRNQSTNKSIQFNSIHEVTYIHMYLLNWEFQRVAHDRIKGVRSSGLFFSISQSVVLCVGCILAALSLCCSYNFHF